MARKTVDERVADIKLKEAARLEDKARDLRAKAILLEDQAKKLRNSAEQHP